MRQHPASIPGDDVADLPPPSTLEEHGRRLVELLDLADAIGHRPRGELTFPRIDSTTGRSLS